MLPRESSLEPRSAAALGEATAAGSRLIEWLARVPVVLVAVVSLVVLGLPAIFVLGPRPTLEPTSATAGAVKDTAISEPRAAAKPASTRATARVTNPAPRKVAAGLFYAGSVGRFLVERREREIEWFDVDACGLSGRVGPIQITPSRTFAFYGAVASGRLAISGQFVAPGTTRGIVSGRTCPRPVRFGARR